MANKISIDTELMEQLSSQITQLQRSLTAINEKIGGSVSEVRRVASEQTGIINKLVKIQKNTASTAERTGKLARAVRGSADRWEEAEKRIANQKLGETNGNGNVGIGVFNAFTQFTLPYRVSKILEKVLKDPSFKPPQWKPVIGPDGSQIMPMLSPEEAIAKWMKYPSDPGSWSQTMKDNFLKNLKDAETFQFPDGTAGVAIGTNILLVGAGGMTVLSPSTSFTNAGMTMTHYGTDGSWQKVDGSLGIGGGWSGKLQTKDDKGNWNKVQKKADPLGPQTDELIGGKTKADRIGEIATIGGEVKAEGAALHGEVKGEKGIASGEASYNVSHGEAHASFKAGLYATKVDADGKVHYSLEPGIEAKAGASYSVFDAAASGKIGNDYLNVHGDAGVTVGKVSGEAELQAGFVDGKFSAHAGASAEAIAAEAHASAGVDVMGIDAKATGSVNVGIGAHADVGYHDGTFHVDVGASLGVGASIKVDVDVSGFIDNVADKAGDAIDAVKGFGESVFNHFFG